MGQFLEDFRAYHLSDIFPETNKGQSEKRGTMGQRITNIWVQLAEDVVLMGLTLGARPKGPFSNLHFTGDCFSTFPSKEASNKDTATMRYQYLLFRVGSREFLVRGVWYIRINILFRSFFFFIKDGMNLIISFLVFG